MDVMGKVPIGEICGFIFVATFAVNIFLKIYDIKITYDAKKKWVCVENTGNKSMTIIDVEVKKSDTKEKIENVEIFYNPFLAAKQKKTVCNLEEVYEDVLVTVKCKCYLFITITTTFKIAKSGEIEIKQKRLELSCL